MDEPIAALAVALAVGVGAQLVGERLRIPSIILLLAAGLAVGPALGLLAPDPLYGDLLFPPVSAAVAVLLFDGGLSLRWRELGAERLVVARLLSVGTAISWGLAGFGAWAVGALPLGPSVLFGAIMVVTGPTVVIPLLRQARLRPRLARTLRWEGIFVDPVGAVLAIVVLEVLLVDQGGFTEAVGVLVAAVAAGVVVGLLAAALLVYAVGRHVVPDHLENGFALMVVLASGAGANALYAEAGLFAATVCGVALANQRRMPVRRIAAFHESIGPLLIPLVFVLLGARVSADDITTNLVPALAILAILVRVARPLSVVASTAGSGLTARERIYVGLLAPRGIVAASVSALLGLRLEEAGIAGGADPAATTFLVVAGTVVLYGLGAIPLAKRLRVDVPEPAGVVFVGAPRWASRLAHEMVNTGIQVVVLATDDHEISEARAGGMLVYSGRLQSEELTEVLDAVGARLSLVVSGREELAVFAAERLAEGMGRANVFVVPPDDRERAARTEEHGQDWGRVAFGGRLTGEEMAHRLAGGQVFRRMRWQADQSLPEGVAPLVFVSADGIPTVIDGVGPPRKAGTLVVLGQPLVGPASNGKGGRLRRRLGLSGAPT